MNTLGSRIKKARGKVSQEAFAREIEVSKGSLGFYERDENLPNTNVILKICSVTKVLPEWLLMGSGPMYNEGGLANATTNAPITCQDVDITHNMSHSPTSGMANDRAYDKPNRMAHGAALGVNGFELNCQQGASPQFHPVNTSEKDNSIWALRCEMLEKKLDKVESQRDDLSLENRELWRRIGHLMSENFELRLALERKGGVKEKAL